MKALGFNAWRNPPATGVALSGPSFELRQKWQLATENDYSHIICMPGISRSQVDEFLEDLKKELVLA